MIWYGVGHCRCAPLMQELFILSSVYVVFCCVSILSLAGKPRPVAIVAALGLVWRRRYPGAPVVGCLLGAYRYCRCIGGIIDALVIPSYRHPVCCLGVVSSL